MLAQSLRRVYLVVDSNGGAKSLTIESGSAEDPQAITRQLAGYGHNLIQTDERPPTPALPLQVEGP